MLRLILLRIILFFKFLFIFFLLLFIVIFVIDGAAIFFCVENASVNSLMFCWMFCCSVRLNVKK